MCITSCQKLLHHLKQSHTLLISYFNMKFHPSAWWTAEPDFLGGFFSSGDLHKAIMM